MTPDELLVAEATKCNCKETLEVKNPKGRLKLVSAFANGTGGALLFGIADRKEAMEC